MTSGHVVVTGAANGLGAAIAHAAVEAGWTVGVLDHDGEAATRTAVRWADEPSR